MSIKLTRRQLGAAIAAALPAAAQQTPAPPRDDLTIQKENIARNLEAMRKVAIPVATEPSFTFKA